jgi:hypothetical protein
VVVVVVVLLVLSAAPPSFSWEYPLVVVIHLAHICPLAALPGGSSCYVAAPWWVVMAAGLP